MTVLGDQLRSAPSSTKRGALVAGAIGLVTGLVVGAVGTAIAVGWAIFNAVDSQASAHVPLVIDVAVVDGTVRAESGDGLVVPALVCAVVGASIGVAIWALRRRR
ncbi:hypothetical protein [Leifsonia sp. Le1]|uniref:hypothetical protein n=1 Tax=Leifsonia sp. Le1 TaxID=3404918 RepID=UPI003EBF51E7